MNFTEIKLELPNDILTLFKEVEKIEPNSCIAGGFLCDLYLKKEFNDVDIFINSNDNVDDPEIFEKLKNKGFNLENIEYIDGYYNSSRILSAFKFYFSGYKINFIFNGHGKKSAYYFDVCFREFYFSKNKCYASEKALLDIENKVLSVGLCQDPLTSLERLYSFKEKYNFEFSDAELLILKSVFFNIVSHSLNNINSYEVNLIETLKDKKFTKRDFIYNFYKNEIEKEVLFQSDLLGGEININTFSFPKKNIMYQLLHNIDFCNRKEFHEIYFKEFREKKEICFKFESEFVFEELSKKASILKERISKNLINFAFENLELSNEIKKNLNNDFYFYNILIKKIKKFRGGPFTVPGDSDDFKVKLAEEILNFEKENDQLIEFSEGLKFTFDFEGIINNNFIHKYSINDLNKVVCIKIEKLNESNSGFNSFSAYYFNVFYNLEKNEIDYSNSNISKSSFIDDFLQKAINNFIENEKALL